MDPTSGRTNGHVLAVVVMLAVAGSAAAQQQQPSPPPGYFGPVSFNPSMAIVIVVLITAFFFLGFFSIYIRRCAGDRFGAPGYAAGRGVGGFALTTAARSRRQRGLDPAVIETFPTMAYADVKAHKAGKGALECAVCLSEFDDDETLRLLPKCSHVFHPDCIDAWLASHVSCPVCRANLVPDPDAPAAAALGTEQDAPAPQQPVQQAAAPASAPAVSEQSAAAVVIDVEETEEEKARREEAAELMRIGSVKRALRAKSGRRPAPFLRSHSTGHSLAAPAAESAERFTLRLPEHVLRQAVAAGKLQRTTSLLASRTGGDGSTRRGLRAGGEGTSRAARSVRLGRSGRWPSFLARTFSARLPAWGSVRRGDADASSKGGKTAGAGKGVECDDQLGRRV